MNNNDEFRDYMFGVWSDGRIEEWRRILGDPGMPRFPMDAQVLVGVAPVDRVGRRYELTVIDDGQHVVHRCPVTVETLADQLWVLGVIGGCR